MYSGSRLRFLTSASDFVGVIAKTYDVNVPGATRSHTENWCSPSVCQTPGYGTGICLLAVAENTPVSACAECSTLTTRAWAATVSGHVLTVRFVETMYSTQSPKSPNCADILVPRTSPQPISRSVTDCAKHGDAPSTMVAT